MTDPRHENDNDEIVPDPAAGSLDDSLGVHGHGLHGGSTLFPGGRCAPSFAIAAHPVGHMLRRIQDAVWRWRAR
jgi:hypothetical protein